MPARPLLWRPRLACALALTLLGACDTTRAAATTEPQHASASVELSAEDLSDRFAVPVSEFDPARGAAEPLVTLVLFIDYATAPQTELAHALEQLLGLHGDRLRVVLKPITSSSDAKRRYAAQAVLAAAAQGRGWEMHGRLLQHGGELARKDAHRLAREAGVADLAAFERDLDDQAPLDANEALALRLGVNPACVVFINGGAFPGLEGLNALREAYTSELARAQAMLADGGATRSLYPAIVASAAAQRTAILPLEPPYDGAPEASEMLDSGVLVETFATGEGAPVEQGMVVSFTFSGYGTTLGKKVMGSRSGPSQLVILSENSDPIAQHLSKALRGRRVGARMRVTMPRALFVTDNAPSQVVNIGDLVMTVELVDARTRPPLADRSRFAGQSPAGHTDADGLEIADYTTGEGRVAAAGDEVEVHYLMDLEDGTELDSSHDRPDGMVALADGPKLIKGLSRALIGARAGMLRKVVVPPELGYGDKAKGKIPANSTLVFYLQIIEVRDPSSEPDTEPDTEPNTEENEP